MAAVYPPRAPSISGSRSDTESSESSDYDSLDETSDEDEDEDGIELTPALDAAILSTLSKIKRKEGVYAGELVLEQELERAKEKAAQRGLKVGIVKKAEKPFLLADYHRSKLLDGHDDDEEYAPEPLTHVQSERLLRQEAVSAFQSLAADADSSDDEFMQKRVVGDQDDGEDEEYKRFMLEMGGGEDQVRGILGMGDQPAVLMPVDEEESEDDTKRERKRAVSKVEKQEIALKKTQRMAKKAKNDDDFLLNYILNRGWIDRTDDHVPTYDQVVGPSDADADADAPAQPTSAHPWGMLDEMDDFEDRAEQFETEYNFRFEEPGATSIATHPRDIPSLVRRPDDVRKSKRARRAERKAAEKAAMEDSIKKERKGKRKEMERRMADLKRDLEKEGVKGLEWGKLEKVLDGEWDENVWENVVGEMLSRGGGEEKVEDDHEKPTWDDDLGDVDYDQDDEQGGFEYDQGQVEDDADAEDDGPINMDADFIDEAPAPKKKSKDRGKRTRDRSPSVVLEDDPSLSIPEKAARLRETVESYNALAHEDIIQDLPTRFKYTPAPAASFGLSPAEILMATDEELNQLVSMKSIAPYRRGGIGMQGKGLGQRVRELKGKLSHRRWGQQPMDEKKDAFRKKRIDGQERGREEGAEEESGKDEHGEKKRAGKRMGKKERLKLQKAAAAAGAETPPDAEGPSSRKRKLADDAAAPEVKVGQDDSGEKKKRRKKKKSKAEGEP